MRFRNSEDRLNPVAPEEADEGTLGGYPAVHGRAPAFEASDGQPYTVAVETDTTGDPAAPWTAYLVFVRWAQTGTAIMGHVETGDLAHAETEAAARSALEALSLDRVKEILEETLRRKQDEEADV